MSEALLHWGPAVFLWLAAAYKLPALHRNAGDPGLRAYCLTIVSFAMAFTLLAPPVYQAFDRLAGVPNIARLLANSLGLVSCWSVQAFLAYLSKPASEARTEIRRLGWALAGCLILMTLCFAAAPVDQEAVDFSGRYGAAPFVLEYRLIFLSYLGLAAANVARLSWRFAGIADRPALRLGLRLNAIGGLVGLIFVAQEGLYVIANRLALSYPIPNP
ncbi:MAB_1171c family putative transporter, partial [Nitrolancea hollandica]|uniref:MAB_1171c family putative transporter n=1 Tax=Nitrolancea hollandica TaxID=1206749 RepID=UPI00058D54B4